MKYTTTQLCIACCLSAGLTFAQDGAKKPGGEGGAPNRMAEFLKRLDADADGKVTKDEFLAFTKKEGEDRFAKIDANGDGAADEAELKTAAEKMRAGGGEGRRDMRGNEGGGFRRPPGAEGGAPPEGQARRPEGGPPGEGQPRRPEGGPPGEGQPRRPEGGPPGEGQGRGSFGGPGGAMMGGNLEEAFKKMDSNSDGSVTKEEFHSFSSQEIDGRFGRMDTNSDGKVTLEEIKAATEKLREMMRGRMGGGQGGEGMRRPGGEGGGFRRPGGEGGEGGGFRRPPSQEGGDRPRPEAEGDKKPGGV